MSETTSLLLAEPEHQVTNHEALDLERVLELQDKIQRTAQTVVEELPDRFGLLDKDNSFYETKRQILHETRAVEIGNYLKQLEPDEKIRTALSKELHELVAKKSQDLEAMLKEQRIASKAALIPIRPIWQPEPDLPETTPTVPLFDQDNPVWFDPVGKSTESVLFDQDNPVWVEYTSSADKIQELFEGIVNDTDQPELTRKILTKHPELMPVAEVKAKSPSEGKTFYFSRIINGLSRRHVIMFTQNNKGLWVPRFLYKSKSDGTWRSAAYVYDDGVYRKGRHYTQDTKIADELLDYLESVKGEKSAPYQGISVADDYFTRASLGNLLTIEHETTYVGGPELDQFQELLPGEGFISEQHTDKPARELMAELVYPDGFIPDFTKESVRVVVREHSVLGAVTYESYQGRLGDGDVEWVMARDSEGRVWIDRIRLINNQITTYGTDRRILLSGMLTNKPLEYRSQCEGLVIDTDMVPFMDGVFETMYHDITPLLDNLLPIEQYRQARNIQRKISKVT